MADRKIEIRIGARDEATSVFDRISHGLDRLKQRTGSRSDLKEITDLVRGGGAVAGLALAGRAFNEFATKASEVALALRTGATSVEQTVAELVRGVPILGQFIQGWDKIRDAIDGSKKALEEIREAERQENRETRDRILQGNNRRKAGLITAAAAAEQDSANREELRGLVGADLNLAQKRIELAARERAAASLAISAGSTSDIEVQKRVRSAANEQRIQIEKDRQQALIEYDRELAEQAKREAEQTTQEINRALDDFYEPIEEGQKIRDKMREFAAKAATAAFRSLGNMAANLGGGQSPANPLDVVFARARLDESRFVTGVGENDQFAMARKTNDLLTQTQTIIRDQFTQTRQLLTDLI